MLINKLSFHPFVVKNYINIVWLKYLGVITLTYNSTEYSSAVEVHISSNLPS